MKTTDPAPCAFALPSSQPIDPVPDHGGFEGKEMEARCLHAEILCRAHSIWECKGRPDNSGLADWLQAEAEVMGER